MVKLVTILGLIFGAVSPGALAAEANVEISPRIQACWDSTHLFASFDYCVDALNKDATLTVEKIKACGDATFRPGGFKHCISLRDLKLADIAYCGSSVPANSFESCLSDKAAANHFTVSW